MQEYEEDELTLDDFCNLKPGDTLRCIKQDGLGRYGLENVFKIGDPIIFTKHSEEYPGILFRAPYHVNGYGEYVFLYEWNILEYFDIPHTSGV